jgi:ribonuclease-3
MGGRQKDVILADGLEALIGFLVLDQWQDVAQTFILTYIYPEIKDLEWFTNKSYKTLLQEVAQSQTKITPHYIDTSIQEDNKGNPTLFESIVMMGDRELWRWTGINKKKAQEAAAQQWYTTLLQAS